MNTQQYLDLITSEHKSKEKFNAVVLANISIPAYLQDIFSSMIPIFDIDNASGNQLDIIGEWVGVSRDIGIPIAANYFSWDDPSYSKGWDYGTWQPDNAPTSITILPDDSYKILIKAKIAANHWDGTIEGAYAIWDSIFTNISVLIQDNHDMTYNLIIVGALLDSLTLALITGNYIPLRPEGVRVRTYLIPIDSNPGFAWDIENTYLKGWDEGSWLIEVTP